MNALTAQYGLILTRKITLASRYSREQELGMEIFPRRTEDRASRVSRIREFSTLQRSENSIRFFPLTLVLMLCSQRKSQMVPSI